MLNEPITDKSEEGIIITTEMHQEDWRKVTMLTTQELVAVVHEHCVIQLSLTFLIVLQSNAVSLLACMRSSGSQMLWRIAPAKLIIVIVNGKLSVK